MTGEAGADGPPAYRRREYALGPAHFAAFRLSAEMLDPAADHRWHDTDSTVIADAMLAEGFCPRGHGPLAPALGPHTEFYGWCHTCGKGWGIQSIHHGDERVDLEVTTWPPDECGFPEAVGPAQLSIYEILNSKERT